MKVKTALKAKKPVAKTTKSKTKAVIEKKLKKPKVKDAEKKKTAKAEKAPKEPVEQVATNGKAKVSKKKKAKHSKEIESLKSIDPEFYKFLKQNDKQLLDFNFLDSDDDEEEEIATAKEVSDDEEGSGDEDDEKYHKPSEKLEVASDESDFEDEEEREDDDEDDEEESSESKTVTLKLLRSWQMDLQKSNVNIQIIRKVVQAFSSALATVVDQETKVGVYKVDGAAAFNGVIQLCVLHLQPAIYKFLGLAPKSKTPIHKTKKWKKIRACLGSYLTDLTTLVAHVSSSNILSVLLKHLHQMAGMVGSFPGVSKDLLKRLITLWSTSEETVRVLSFLCILKITRAQQVSTLDKVLKTMYLAYVRNSKFVSPNTLPAINFLRRSLVEMFALDLNVAYQHAFLFIRQLAILLRNAVILKKKESFQSVYNWQFVNSIKFWVELLGQTTNKPQLQPLVFPLVSITIGVIKLIPTAQYFPLRFHCIQALITLCKESNIFVPVLPFILEVLNSATFNKKHTIASMKPMQFTCILRLNKSQLAENGFRDEVVENVCGLLLEYLAHESGSLAYPDLVVPAVAALKQYLKVCKNSNHSRKLKQLLDRIIDNSKFVEEERKKITFGLKDTALVQSWETQIRNKGTPLSIYYASWLKTHETKKRRQAASTDDINDYDIPMIKRKKDGAKRTNADGEVELFPSDDEDDELEIPVDGEEEEEEPQEKKKSKKPKKEKKAKKAASQQVVEEDNEENPDEIVDIVENLDIDDW